MKRITALAVALATVPLAAACGSGVPAPRDQWAAAQADVGRAEASGASNVPDAKLHLQLAVEDLQKARQLIDADNTRATTLTGLARAEAQLAVSITKANAEQDEARQAQADLQKAHIK
jgi:hypothetical protein